MLYNSSHKVFSNLVSNYFNCPFIILQVVFLKNILFYVHACMPECMHVYHACACCLHRAEDSAIIQRNEDTDDCKP